MITPNHPKPPASPIISLLLHDVTDQPLSSGFRQPTAQKYKHPVDLFRRYAETVRQSGLSVVSSFPLPEDRSSVIFTFDDGGVSALTAADILESEEWRGVFFVTTDLIDHPGFLSQQQVVELSDRGHAIGSHSCSHPDVFRDLSPAEMHYEWTKSRDVLEQLLGRPVTLASVPGGDISAATITQAAAAGLNHVFTSEQTTHAWRQSGICCYGRMMMLNRTTPKTLQRWLRYPSLGILPERAIRFSKSSAKTILGPTYRELVRKRRALHEKSEGTSEADGTSFSAETKTEIPPSAVKEDSETLPRQQDRFSKSFEFTKKRNRVVALINPTLHGRSTCAELLQSGVNLVGIVEAQTKTKGLPLATFRRLCRKKGLIPALSQVAARLVYLATNRKADRDIYRTLFDESAVLRTLKDWNGPTISCRSYADSHTLRAIRELEPDILVVHSQSWVGPKVREIPTTGLVIGGHPGITPHFRGSHSSFWALLNNQPEKIGWTAFHVDKGVDTGDVIVQGRLQVQPGDSYMTLNWQGMKQIAKAQATAILEFDSTGHITRKPHTDIPADSEFGLPRLGEYLEYCRTQNLAR